VVDKFHVIISMWFLYTGSAISGCFRSVYPGEVD